jgi:hypothetical protein
MNRLLATIAAFVLGLVLGIMADKYALFEMFAPKPIQASATTAIKEMLPIGEYASLAYYYTNVVTDISNNEVLGWGVPFTTKKFIFSYDGVIKLGVDTDGITVEEEAENPVSDGQEVRLKLRLMFPPIRVLSHETIDGTFKVYDQSGGFFNSIKIEDAWDSLPRFKRQMAQKALLDAAKQARISMETQIKGFLERLPAVQEKHYTFEFVWTEAAKKPVKPATTTTPAK